MVKLESGGCPPSTLWICPYVEGFLKNSNLILSSDSNSVKSVLQKIKNLFKKKKIVPSRPNFNH
jgi:hypothetical protein